MKKFNNTLEGTDCGDAGLPAHGRGIAKAKKDLGHAVSGDVVMGRPNAARGEDIGVALPERIGGVNDCRLFVADDPALP
jgi:hypothetical protein